MPDSDSDNQKPGKKDPELQKKLDAARNVVALDFGDSGSPDPEACNAFLEKQEPDLYKDLLDIVKKRSSHLLVARRMQIYRIAQAELYNLGKQHIIWDDDMGWMGASARGVLLPAHDDRVEDIDSDKNFYKAYGEAYQTTASENVPPIPFIPDGGSREDLDAAKNATLASQLIARNNDAPMLMADYAYHGWTGGVMATYTRTVTDGDLFGWKTDPETGEPMMQNGKKVPRSQVVISVHGGLDITLPETASSDKEMDHLAFHLDIPKSTGRATYPWVKSIIASKEVGEDDNLSRLFRVAVRANVEPKVLTESLDDITTLVRIWLKPSTFFEITDDKRREALLDKFPDGVCLHYLSGTFCAAIPDRMGKRWAIEFASKGRGTKRPGLGDSFIPVQDDCNMLGALYNAYLVRGAPTIFHEQKVVNREALAKMEAKPFQFMPANMSKSGVPVTDMGNLFYATPTVEVPAGLIERLTDISVGAVAQFITGIFPAMSGAGLGETVQQSATGAERQFEQSMGRIALFYRRIRSLHQRTMYLAVKEFADSESEQVTLSAPGKKAKAIDPIAIRKGQFCVYPEADEGQPVLFRDKREQLGSLLTNPAFAPSIPEFDNLDLIRRIAGFNDFVITGEDAWIKQGKEIEEMIAAHPDPEEEMQAQQQVAQQEAEFQAQNPQPMPPEGQPATPAPTAPPQPQSSLQIQPLDNDAVELKRCAFWASSEEGMQTFVSNPPAYQDIMAHAELHKQRMQQNAPKPPDPNEKPISWTAALDKMPVEIIVQKLAEVGLKVDPMSVALQKDAAKPAPPVPPVASNGHSATQ